MPSDRRHLASLVLDFERLGGDVAVVEQHGLRRKVTTYGELAVLAKRYAAELARRGIGKGDRVVLCGENSASWTAAFFGCLLRGVMAVPLDAGSTAGFAQRVVGDTGARVCMVDHSRAAVFEGLSPILRFEATDQLPERGEGAIDDLSWDDPFQIIFTSGTTGDPKGVVHTHGNVLASLRPIEEEMEKYRRYERWFHPVRVLHTLPLSHVFGQFMGLWVPGLIGLEIHHRNRVVGSELIEYIRGGRISVLAAVPRVLGLLAEALLGTVPNLRERMGWAEGLKVWQRWWHFRDVHRMLGWKFWALVCGGAALPPETEAFWGTLGFAVVQGYGMTETTALVSLNHPFRPARGTVGQVLPGREVRLGDDGEVLVRGETISGTTWQDGRMQRAESEWLATGDLAERDASGNLRFRGRKKDVIVTAAGLNVYPEDLEAALRRQQGVRDAAVLEAEGANGPEALAALILDAGAAALPAIAGANGELAEYQQIRRWVVWAEPDFPRTSTGKVLRREIAARAASQAVSAGEAGSLELDSLGRVELQAKLEAQYGVSLPDEAMQEMQNTSDWQRLVREAHVLEDPHRYPHWYPRWPWSWPMQWVRSVFLEAVAMPLLRLLAAPGIRLGYDATGWPKGPVLVVANHVTSYDAPFVLAALPGRVRRRVAIAMSGEMILDWRRARNQPNWWLNWLAPLEYWLVTALFNIFPLPQRSGFRRSFQHAGEAVDRGYSVLVFPEGRRSEDGSPQPFLGGSGLLWKELAVPGLAVRLEGLGELKMRERGWFRSGKIMVVAGPVLEAPGDGESPEELTERLRNAVFEQKSRSPEPDRAPFGGRLER